MQSLEEVLKYFRESLPQRQPPGLFLLTAGRIAERGIAEGELLVFSYNGEIVYIGQAASERMNNNGPEHTQYPFYFLVDVHSLRRGCGRLEDLEAQLRAAGFSDKNIARTQGWPVIEELAENRGRLTAILAEHVSNATER